MYYTLKLRNQSLAASILLAIILFLLTTSQSTQAATQSLYDDDFGSGWQSWSWGTSLNAQDTTQQKSGTSSLSVRFDTAGVALQLRSDVPLNVKVYRAVGFWVHGGFTGGQQINFVAIDTNGTWHAPVPIIPLVNEWVYYELTFAEMGNPASIAGFAWQDGSGGSQARFYLDEIVLLEDLGNVDRNLIAHQLNVDPERVIRPISPLIYGMSFANNATVADLDLPLNRWGGNATSRYNPDQDVSNRASDYYFENIPNDVLGELPQNSALNRFVTDNQLRGSQALLTLPLIGWIPKDRSRACGFSVAKYGQQDSVDPWNKDCGNGMRNGQPVTGNDPNDTSMAVNAADVKEWMAALQAQHNGSVQLFSLDNEPMLWHLTHRDVHPNPVGYDEIRDLTYAYAPAFKAVQPSAELLGPGVWGWTAYDFSGIDAVSKQWLNPPDRNAHNGTPFVEWYLQEMQRYEQDHGVRILDYVDIHFYPQQQGVTLQPAGSSTTQQLRLNATRSLWDPTYVDESWINEPMQMIPRMQAWVDQNYPDTKLAITEYNFGGVEHINGAVAQAEALGVFGREGLDLAVMWDPPAANEPAMNAFRIYRNYDGYGSKFGELSLSAASSDADALSIFAARRATDQALTLLVVNKTFEAVSADLNVAGVGSVSAERFQYSSANLSAIQRLNNVSFSADQIDLTLPSQSFTLLVIGGDGSPTPEPTSSATPQATKTPQPTNTSLPPATNTPLPTKTSTLPVTNTPSPAPTNTPLPTQLSANGESTRDGSIRSGNYSDTWQDDNQAEVLVEMPTGGKPNRRSSLLTHNWFVTPHNAPTQLIVNAWGSENNEGDTFTFSYSTDGSTFTEAFTVIAGVDAYYDAALPSGVTTIRVQDDDRTQGNRTLDTLTVDYIAIVTNDGTPSPTIEPSNTPIATIVPSKTPLPTAEPTQTPTLKPTVTTSPTAIPTSISTATATPPPTAEPTATLPVEDRVDYAIRESTQAGSRIAGDLFDTQTTDGSVEHLREQLSTHGAAKKRYSFVEHRWTINVTGGSVSTLLMNAWAIDSDADRFVLAFSADNSTFTEIFTLTDSPTDYAFMLPSGTQGEITIRLQDTNRKGGQRDLGNVYVDYLAVVNENTAGQSVHIASSDLPTVSVPNQLQVMRGNTVSLPIWIDGSAETASFTLTYDSGWFIADDQSTYTLINLQPDVTFNYTLDAPNGILNVIATGNIQRGSLFQFNFNARHETPHNRVFDMMLTSSSANVQSGALYVLDSTENPLNTPTVVSLQNATAGNIENNLLLIAAMLLIACTCGILIETRCAPNHPSWL